MVRMSSIKRLSFLGVFAPLAAFAAVMAHAPSASAFNFANESTAVPQIGALCDRSVDVAYTAGRYFLAFVQGPCASAGTFEVRLGILDPASPATFSSVVVRAVTAMSPVNQPLIRLATLGSNVSVVVIDRSNAINSYYTHTYSAALAPSGVMGPFNMLGTALDVSYDCAPGMAVPCVLTTRESVVMRGQHVAYFSAGAGTLLTPPLGRTDAVIGASAYAGVAGAQAALYVTDSNRETVPHAMAALVPSGHAMLGGRSALALPGIIGVHQRSGSGVALWSAGNRIEYRVGAHWTALSAMGDTTVSGATHYFIEDGAQIGNSMVIVGRNAGSPMTLESGALAIVAFAPIGASQMFTAFQPGIVPRSPARIAAATDCASRALGVTAYAVGGTLPVEIRVRTVACTIDNDCVDPMGNLGRCSSGSCSFTAPSPCAIGSDGGVDGGMLFDASLSDAVAFDGTAVEEDASTAVRDTGVAMDGTATGDATGVRDSGVPVGSDASAADGASVQDSAMFDGATPEEDGASALDGAVADAGGPANDGATTADSASSSDSGKPPAITGGACACRAPAGPARGALPSLVALCAVALCASARPRRRQRA